MTRQMTTHFTDHSVNRNDHLATMVIFLVIDVVNSVNAALGGRKTYQTTKRFIYSFKLSIMPLVVELPNKTSMTYLNNN